MRVYAWGPTGVEFGHTFFQVQIEGTPETPLGRQSSGVSPFSFPETFAGTYVLQAGDSQDLPHGCIRIRQREAKRLTILALPFRGGKCPLDKSSGLRPQAVPATQPQLAVNPAPKMFFKARCLRRRAI